MQDMKEEFNKDRNSEKHQSEILEIYILISQIKNLVESFSCRLKKNKEL
jgi:hypothetical protein